MSDGNIQTLIICMTVVLCVLIIAWDVKSDE